MTTRDAIGTMLTGFAHLLANPKPVTDQLVALWMDALSDLDPTCAEIEAAYRRVVRKATYWPVPADVRKAIAEERSAAPRPALTVVENPALPARAARIEGLDIVGPLAKRFGNLMNGGKPHGDH